jgi:putative transposase
VKKHGRCEQSVTDWLRSSGAAMKDLGASDLSETGRWLSNLGENPHLPLRRRERAMLRYCRMRTLQKFASIHASVTNRVTAEHSHFSRTLFKAKRAAALSGWRGPGAA